MYDAAKMQEMLPMLERDYHYVVVNIWFLPSFLVGILIFWVSLFIVWTKRELLSTLNWKLL